METYREFSDRINSFEKAEISFGDGYFRGNPSIAQKVREDNSFGAFYGDTVVFALDEKIKKTLSGYVGLLYAEVSECFCEKLSPSTFHLTLHDLSSSPDLQNIGRELEENERRIREKVAQVQSYANAVIKMKSNAVFNMVNTSLVLGLCPASEDDYIRLLELYGIFDGVKKLNYPFTPHITLAYYNICGFSLQSAQRLKSVVGRLNENEIETTLKVKDLYYQRFESMNNYTDMIGLAK